MLFIFWNFCCFIVDQIYHLASPASPPNYMYNPIKTLKTNTIGTLNMLGKFKLMPLFNYYKIILSFWCDFIEVQHFNLKCIHSSISDYKYSTSVLIGDFSAHLVLIHGWLVDFDFIVMIHKLFKAIVFFNNCHSASRMQQTLTYVLIIIAITMMVLLIIHPWLMGRRDSYSCMLYNYNAFLYILWICHFHSIQKSESQWLPR